MTSWRPVSLPRVLAMVASMATTGCGGGESGPTLGTVVSSVVVTAPRTVIVVGETVAFTAEPRDAQGRAVTGKAVAWSSSGTTVATVSAAGVVTGVSEGDATISAATDGQIGTVQVSVRNVIAETGRSVSVAVGVNGDTVTTTSTNGISYSLEIPAGALEGPTTITMTPVTGVKGAKFSGGLLGAVQFTPAGLTFLNGVRLRMSGLAAVTAGRVAVGFVGADTGGVEGLLPTIVATGTITLAVPHFSVVGAGAELPAALTGIVPPSDTASGPRPPQFWRNYWLGEIGSALAGSVSRDLLLFVFKQWGLFIERYTAASSGSDGAMMDAVVEFSLWRSTIEFASSSRADLASLWDDAELAGPRGRNEFQTIGGLNEAIARANLACRTNRSFASAELVLFWQLQGAALGLAALEGTVLDGTPDLGRTNVLALFRQYCLAVVLDVAQLASPLEVGVPTDLTTFFKVQFVGQGVRDNGVFQMLVQGTNAAVAAPVGATDAAGRYVTGVTAGTAGPVAVDVSAALVFPGHTFATLPAHLFGVIATETISRSAVSSLAITTATLPDGVVGSTYAQTLQASGGIGAYAWSIVSGQLPPGLSLNSASGAIAGTPTTEGAFSFTARVTSGTQAQQRSFNLAIDPGAPSGCTGTFAAPGGLMVVSSRQLLASVATAEVVSGHLHISGIADATLLQIDLPCLKSVTGSLSISGNPHLGRIEFPALEEVGDFVQLTSNGALTTARLPLLRLVGANSTLAGSVTVLSNAALATLVIGPAEIRRHLPSQGGGMQLRQPLPVLLDLGSLSSGIKTDTLFFTLPGTGQTGFTDATVRAFGNRAMISAVCEILATNARKCQ